MLINGIKVTLPLSVAIVLGGCEPSSEGAPSLQQKIIWNFNGSYTYQNSGNSDPFVRSMMSDQNSDYVSNYCLQINENIDEYTRQGWRIISTSPATRNVPPQGLNDGGYCQGRDIFIEKDS